MLRPVTIASRQFPPTRPNISHLSHSKMRRKRAFMTLLKLNAAALLENHFYTCLADTMTKVNQLRRGARRRYREGNHAAEILVVGILGELADYLLVGNIAHVLQYQKAYHQADWLWGTTALYIEQRGEGGLKGRPVYKVSQLEQRITAVQHCLKIPEQCVLSMTGGGFVHIQFASFYGA